MTVFIATVMPFVGFQKYKHSKIHKTNHSLGIPRNHGNRLNIQIFLQGEDSYDMDGFYDQQVPFVASESVSFKDFKHICHLGKRGGSCDQFLLFKLQKWPSEVAEKCLSERKRKFMDTELAQDTEGSCTIYDDIKQ